MKKVVVTGSRGYIGSALVQYLQGLGYDVTGIDLPEDIQNISVAHLAGCHAVIHLAGNSRMDTDVPEERYLQLNVDAVHGLAINARVAGVKHFIFASTAMLYRDDKPGWKTEDMPVRFPDNLYLRSKYLAESKLREEVGGDMAITVLRLGSVFGVSPVMRHNFGLNNLVAQAVCGGRMQVRSHRETAMSYVHVHDVCAVIAEVMARSASTGLEVFNVASVNCFANFETLTGMIAKACGVKEIEVLREGAPFYMQADGGAIERLPGGFSYKYDLKHGIAELREYYKAHQHIHVQNLYK